jgi:hypothetical protein
MTAREMHIEFDTLLQRTLSEAYDTFLIEEIDWLLNLAQQRIIKTRLTQKSNRRQEGYEEVNKRYDDIKAILKYVSLPVFVNDEVGTSYSILPYDYFLYDKVRANLFYNCNSVTLNEVAQGNYFIGNITFPAYSTTVTDPFKNLTIQLKDYNDNYTFVFDINDYPDFASSITDKDLKFAVILAILEVVNSNVSDLKLRWQRHDNTIYNNYFVAETSKLAPSGLEPYYKAIRISIDGVGVETNLTAYSANLNTTSSLGSDLVSVARLVKTEDVWDTNAHPFAKTTHKSPIVTLKDNRIIVYTNKQFYVKNLELYYLKQPRKINLKLGIDCELSEEIHTEIVSTAVQIAASSIISPNYKSIINENLISE